MSMRYPIPLKRYPRAYFVYLIVTIGRKNNSYRICKFKPKHLKLNEFAWYFKISIDKDEWLDRIKEADLGKAEPPNFPECVLESELVEKTEEHEVFERITGV